MRNLTTVLALGIALTIGGCTRRNNEAVGREVRKAEQGSEKAARELGKVAYKAARETGKLAAKAGHQLSVATGEAHQGWKEEKAREQAKERERQSR